MGRMLRNGRRIQGRDRVFRVRKLLTDARDCTCFCGSINRISADICEYFVVVRWGAAIFFYRGQYDIVDCKTEYCFLKLPLGLACCLESADRILS